VVHHPDLELRPRRRRIESGFSLQSVEAITAAGLQRTSRPKNNAWPEKLADMLSTPVVERAPRCKYSAKTSTVSAGDAATEAPAVSEARLALGDDGARVSSGAGDGS
jgi:hypothetical protein